METESNEGVAAQNPTIPAIQVSAIHPGSTQQSTFRFAASKNIPCAAPLAPRELSYFEWSIVTNSEEIDGTPPSASTGNDPNPESMDDDNNQDWPDEIENLDTSGQALEHEEFSLFRWPIDAPNPLDHQHIPSEAGSSTLKGYEYTTFNPTPNNHSSPGTNSYMLVTQPDALRALEDLKMILQPRRDTGGGYKDPEFDLWSRARLEGMYSMLNMFTNQQSTTYNKWGASACQTAIGMGRGQHCARRLCELSRAYLADRKILPINPYGDWNESLLVNENLVNEISLFLLSLGTNITASKLANFLHQPEIKEKYGIERDISQKSATRYLHALGYRYQLAPKGQYVDGHEREDVITYRRQVFLPNWKKYMPRMAVWDKDLTCHLPSIPEKQVIAWFHDESVFYAHDRRKKGWYHKDASAKPYAKGEGESLMVADYVSADLGWLLSQDGKKSARRLFKPGANRDGYFTNQEIIEQADDAIKILKESYPAYDHILIYDNATTHLKCPEDSLSARRMPKNIPKPGKNWGIEVSKRDPNTGKLVYRPDRSVDKIKILMRDACFENGDPQPLYFPMDHPDKNLRGMFKGMAVILEERGFSDMAKVRAECKGFKCAPGATHCCCRRILYNQPDFAEGESLLETHCRAQGVDIIFLPKFLCELNFIEQCWGRAKSVYRTYPPSSSKEDLEANTIRSLESIPLQMMRKFATRSRRFMDAYDRGLDGKQAAWAARKYRGHRVLPQNIMEELGKEGLL